MIRALAGLSVLLAAGALIAGARPWTPLVVVIFTCYGISLVAEGLGMRRVG